MKLLMGLNMLMDNSLNLYKGSSRLNGTHMSHELFLPMFLSMKFQNILLLITSKCNNFFPRMKLFMDLFFNRFNSANLCKGSSHVNGINPRPYLCTEMFLPIV